LLNVAERSGVAPNQSIIWPSVLGPTRRAVGNNKIVRVASFQIDNQTTVISRNDLQWHAKGALFTGASMSGTDGSCNRTRMLLRLTSSTEVKLECLCIVVLRTSQEMSGWVVAEGVDIFEFRPADLDRNSVSTAGTQAQAEQNEEEE